MFLDENLQAILDKKQWGYLASAERLDRFIVEGLASEASRKGKVLGVRLAAISDDDVSEPWKRPPSGITAPRGLKEALPAMVKVVLGQQIFIEKEGLPSPLLNAMKRLAAFQNSEFYKKQVMRLSTAMIPRVIQCFNDGKQHLALPRGCLSALQSLLGENKIALQLID